MITSQIIISLLLFYSVADGVHFGPYPPAVIVTKEVKSRKNPERTGPYREAIPEKKQQFSSSELFPAIDDRYSQSQLPIPAIRAPTISVEIVDPIITSIEPATFNSKPYPAIPVKSNPAPVVKFENSKPYAPAVPVNLIHSVPVVTEYQFNIDHSEILKPYPPTIPAVIVDNTKPYPPAVPVEKVSLKPYPAAVEIAKTPVTPIVTEYHYTVDHVHNPKPYPPAIPEVNSKPYPPAVAVENTKILKPYSAAVEIVKTPVTPIVTEYHYTIDHVENPKPYPPAIPKANSKPYPPSVEIVKIPVTPIVTEYHYTIDHVDKPKPYPPAVPVDNSKPYPPVIPIGIIEPTIIKTSKPYPPPTPVETVIPSFENFPETYPYPPAIPA